MFGQRQAILDAAATRGLLWLGLLFVLSAGLAREYDGEDLLHEPWHVLLPLGASIAGSILLYAVIRPVAWKHHVQEAIDWRGYQTFLGFYWLTAPLAWLYAIPFERFLTPLEAAQANLALLAVVSVWRVLLITRATSVWLGAPFWAMLMPVMLFADTVVLVLALVGGQALTHAMSAMGGIPLERVDRWIGEVALRIAAWAFWTWLVWFFGTTLGTGSKRWTAATIPEGLRVARGLWGVAFAALVVGGVSLFWTQPEQRLRSQAEALMRQDDLEGAVKLMSSHSRADFPPSWNPPPHLMNWQPKAVDMLWTVVHDPQSAPWVRDVYLAKFKAELERKARYFQSQTEEQQGRMLDLLETLPEGPRLVRAHLDELRDSSAFGHDSARRERFDKLLQAAKKADTGDPKGAHESPP